ncbi:MAG: NADH dehydrogenase subunit [Gammaproteobacteria bacterium]|nr:NADH dehydrogenase subunit [Gammaproteobacteria bacterium]MCP5137741.1 NADH dehydrogenase subunit [Gammaproteobacteria bacterium]
MSVLDQLLVFAFMTGAVASFIGDRRFAGTLLAILYFGQFLLLVKLAPLGYGAQPVVSAWQPALFGEVLVWRMDALGWYFALITVVAGWLVTWYASGEWGQGYRERGGNLGLMHTAVAANVVAMLLLLSSGNLLSLFVGWELVSWAGFLLMVMNGRESGGVSGPAGLRYITYATLGAMALLAALAIAHHASGSFEYIDLIDAVDQMTGPTRVSLVIAFALAFTIKMGLLPFHLWQAPAYAYSPGPGGAFLGAISSRVGLWGLAMVFGSLIGIGRIAGIELIPGWFDLRDVFMWVAALTIVLPTFTALRQNDARLLLAWHGIGQGGYMLLGLAAGDALGTGGGLMHVLNHASYQAPLFLAVFAVMHRTGTSDLNRLGGLVARMPLTFLVMLIGIIGLAGLPPMNGFVSKYLVYISLLRQGEPLLFILAVIGTLGTVLSVFKLLHNTFLGQLRVEHMEVREAPWSMLIPMLLMASVVVVTGTAPGLVLDWVASAQAALGLPVLDHTLGGAAGLDMLWVSGVLVYGFAVGTLLFLSGNKSRRVHQFDNYAGGHFLTAENQYQYSDQFYAGLMHHIGGWYRASFTWAESVVIASVDAMSAAANGFFRRTQAVFLLLLATLGSVAWLLWGVGS